MHRYVLCIVLVTFIPELPALGQSHKGLPRDPEIRIGQIPDLVANLPDTEESVVALLEDDDPNVRDEALKELVKPKGLPARIRSSVIRLASSPNSETRALAIGCLAHTPISETSEVAVITNALKDPVATVRLAAIPATAMVEPTSGCTIKNLLATLEDPNPSVQLSAVRTVKDIKCDQAPSVTVLARLSEKASSAQVRTAAVEALGRLDVDIDTTADLLLRLALRDKDAGIRHEAVVSLQHLHSLTPEQISELTPLIHDSSSIVRGAAAFTFVISGHSDPHVLEMLDSLQDDTDEGVRETVAEALGYGQKEKAVLQLVAKSLRDKSDDVKWKASSSLLKLNGDEDKTAAEDPEPSNSWRSSPDEIWPKDLIDASLQVLNQSDFVPVREDVVAAIRRFGVADDNLVKRLSQLASEDSDRVVRRDCVRAVGTLVSNPVTLAALIAATSDRQGIVRDQAVRSLGKLSSTLTSPSATAASMATDVENSLAVRLSDELGYVRITALGALETLGKSTYSTSVATIPRLEATKQQIRENLTNQDPDIRKTAARTLGAIHQGETEIQALISALGDENFEVGKEAAKSLANMDFANTHVRRSVGLASFFGLAMPKSMRDKTTRELETMKPKCKAIATLTASFGELESSELQLEKLRSLAEISANAKAMLTALQEGDMPQDLDFIKAAFAAIEDCAPAVEDAEPFLVQRLNDPDPQIREVAARAVGKLQLQTELVARAIDRLSGDNDPAVRKSALIALSAVIPPDDVEKTKAAVGKLVIASRDTDSDVRLAAVQSIVELKSTDALSQIFRGPYPEVRKSAIEGYKKLGTPALDIKNILRSGLKDRDREVRCEVLSYLESRGIVDIDLLTDVRPLLKDSSATARAAAARVFGYYRAASSFAVPDLNRLLTDEDLWVRVAAAQTLGWIGPQARESVPGLISLLADTVASRTAKVALQQIGDSAIPGLVAVQDEKQKTVTAEIIDAIKTDDADRTFHIPLKDGNVESINLRSTVVIAVETWCPFSERLRNFLARSDVKPYFTGINFQFILEDETENVAAHVQEELKSHTELTEHQKKDKLTSIKKQVASVTYYDRSFLSTLPGKHVQVISLSNLAVNSYPRILAPTTTAMSPADLGETSWLSVNSWAYSDWFDTHVHMPSSLHLELSSISGSVF